MADDSKEEVEDFEKDDEEFGDDAPNDDEIDEDETLSVEAD